MTLRKPRRYTVMPLPVTRSTETLTSSIRRMEFVTFISLVISKLPSHKSS